MEESFEIGPEKNRRYSKKRGSCGKCCIACSVCVVITLIVIVGGGFAVSWSGFEFMIFKCFKQPFP